MAWLKITHELPEKPEVLAIAGKTGLNRFDIVGRLFILWRWFDNNTVDGNARGVTSVTLEACLFGYHSDAGFVTAVVAVGWLTESEDGISVVKFDEHISESAKNRAQTAKRVAKSKANAKGNGEGNGEGNAEGNGASVTKTVPRERVRERDISTSNEVEKPRKRVTAPDMPPDVSEQVWTDWLALRAKKRAPVTETVISGAREEASKAGLSLDRFLAVWCRRGSQGLEASWLKPDERGRAPPESFREREVRMAAEKVAFLTGKQPRQDVIDMEVRDVTPRALGF